MQFNLKNHKTDEPLTLNSAALSDETLDQVLEDINQHLLKKEKKELFDYRADVKDAAKLRSSSGTFSPPNMRDVAGASKGVDAGTANVQDYADLKYGGIASL